MRLWYNHGYSQTRDAFALLRRASSGLTLIASHISPLAAVLLEADVAIVEPPREAEADGDAYVDWCLAFALANRVELFVPQRARSAIARRAAAFAASGVQLVIAADADRLDVIQDKARFYTAAREAGLPTPAAFEIGSLPAFDEAVRTLRSEGRDVCIKPPHGVFAAGFWRLRDDASLFAQLMDPDARELRTSVVRQALAEAGPEPLRLLVMQHLPGPEWSIDAVCRDGALLAGVARRKAGATQRIETSGPALELAAAVARTFGLSHLVNIQLKADEAGALHVLEINPRMGGGCLYAELAGLNLPWLQVLNATGRWPLETPRGRPTTIAPVNAAVALDADGGLRAHA